MNYELLEKCFRQARDFARRQQMVDADFLEKYAELIVKECSYLADQAHYKATNGKSAGGYIRQHFGVEE